MSHEGYEFIEEKMIQEEKKDNSQLKIPYLHLHLHQNDMRNG